MNQFVCILTGQIYNSPYCDVKEIWWEGVDFFHLAQNVVEVAYKGSEKLLGSIKGTEISEYLGSCYVLKKDLCLVEVVISGMRCSF